MGTDDTAFVFEACQDPEIQRWTTVPQPYRAGDAAWFVREAARQLEARTGWWLAICSTESGELLGSIALKDVADGRAEIGYWVASEARGRGIATLALAGLTEWAFVTLGLAELRLRVAAGNLSSMRVAERAGFLEVGREPQACPGGDGVLVEAVVLSRWVPTR